MNFEGTNKYSIFDFDEKATLENTLKLAQVIASLNNLDGKDWKNLRESLYEFCLKEIDHSETGDPYSLGEFVPKIWVFYKGYIAGRNYYRNAKKFKDSLH